jgi:hypothetical protein
MHALFVGEEVSQVPLGAREEVAGQLVLRGIAVGGSLYAVFVEHVDACARVCQQYRRVRRDDELRSFAAQVVHSAKHRELAGERQGGFGFIEDVEPVRSKSVQDQ